MVWNNPGHELEGMLKKYYIDENKEMQIAIWGAGKNGMRLLEYFGQHDVVSCFIDNNTEKIGNYVKGKKVISYEDYLKLNEVKIVISPTNYLGDEIEEQLKKEGKEQYVDYYKYEEFTKDIFPLYELFKYDFLHIYHSQISLTERCSLRCEKCCHGCNLIDRRSMPDDLTLDAAQRSADYFFGNFDRVDAFALLGGEPLLYENLKEIVEYIGVNYRSQILDFYIVTNGTVLPDEELLDVCHKYDVAFVISDYRSTTETLRPRIERIKVILNEKDVIYRLNGTDDWWIDFGFDEIKHDTDSMASFFSTCESQCREIRENRLYYCIMARAYSENSGMNIGLDDYLDLDSDLDGKERKKVIMEYCRGFSKKGWLEMCRYCNGMNKKAKLIPAGVQTGAKK